MSFDFDAAVNAPFRMQPGLRRLADGAAQLTPNIAPERGTACHLREKLAVLQAFPTQALLQCEGFDATLALDALASQASREQPQALAVDASLWRAPILGWAVDPSGDVHELAPGRTPWPEAGECLRALPVSWRRAALLSLAFAEDFAIIDGADCHDPLARRRIAVALGARAQGGSLVRRGACAARGQPPDHRRRHRIWRVW